MSSPWKTMTFSPPGSSGALVEGLHSPRIGVCLDPVNNFAQGESTREVLDNLGVLSVNFHCKDYVIRRKLGGLGFDVEGALRAKACWTWIYAGRGWTRA